MAKKKMPPEIRDYFVKMGKKGGLLGGKARAAKLTDVERSESARQAVLARWGRVRVAQGEKPDQRQPKSASDGTATA